MGIYRRDAIDYLNTPDAVWDRALQVQGVLAEQGSIARSRFLIGSSPLLTSTTERRCCTINTILIESQPLQSSWSNG